jgi:hypothetical protein
VSSALSKRSTTVNSLSAPAWMTRRGIQRHAAPPHGAALDVMGDDDRLGQHLPGRHADGHRAVVRSVELVEHVVHGHLGNEPGDERSRQRRAAAPLR